jgi:ATP-dependent Clp protease, protease subunit
VSFQFSDTPSGAEFQRYATKHLGLSGTALHQYATGIAKGYSPNNLTPNIIEERSLNVISMDVFSRLMMDRIIFMGYPVDDQVANIIMAQLLFLDSADAKRDISIYLNSPGGSVYAGYGIYDVMQYVRPDVNTVCTGMAASMAAVLLAAGVKGKRSALPHARIMIHQPSGGAQGQASEIEIMYKEMQRTRTELYETLAKHTGQTFEKIERDSDRDYWMTAEEAKEYGLVDEVIKSLKTAA